MSPTSWVRFAAVGLLALVLQVGVLDQIVIAATHADLMLVLAVAAGVVLGPQQGATVAFFLGLLADCVVELPFGLSSLTYVLVAFSMGLASGVAAGRDRASADHALCIVGAAAGTLLYALLGALLGQPGMLGAQTAVTVLIVTVGAAILGVPAIWSARWAAAGSDRHVLAVPPGGSALG